MDGTSMRSLLQESCLIPFLASFKSGKDSFEAGCSFAAWDACA